MELTLQTVGISENDIKIIEDIIDNYQNNSLTQNSKILESIFHKDIKAGHYLVLGALMGATLATHIVSEMYNKQFDPCQREN